MKTNTNIREKFLECNTPEEKMKCLISLGQSLPPIPDEDKPASKIQSCTHSIWLKSYKQGDNVFYLADSESSIAKGLLAMLILSFSGLSKYEIIGGTIDFFSTIDFGSSINHKVAELSGIFEIMKSMAKN